VYLILPITLTVLAFTWLLLRKFTLIWIDRPITFAESIIAGIAAWVFLFSIIAWFAGMVVTTFHFISSHDIKDIRIVSAAVLLTGFSMFFINRSRSAFGIEDTQDYLKEAIQFRRSGQHRLDLIALMKQRQKRQPQTVARNDPESLQRARLQASLSKGKELDAQLSLLREGTTVDISELWYTQTKLRSFHSFCEKVQESRIEPNRKRFSLSIDFPEFHEEQLKDETTVLRFNRQLYDFLQSLNAESWLKQFAPFFESYFLICRAVRMNNNNTEVFYPFMKAGILVFELRKVEGFYFNPRKLSEIATVAFNNGAQV
jgi:hypothetical protein